jgi:hypothetical protein
MEVLPYEKLSVEFYLPMALKLGNNSVILSIIETYKKFFALYYAYWLDLYNQVDPMTVDVSFLDFMAVDCASPWRLFWDKNWDVEAKRKLLRDTYKIFSRRLFPDTLIVLFEDFNLRAKLRATSGFILGTSNPPASILPATIGTPLYNYEIVIPSIYFLGSPEYQIVKFIARNFGTPGNINIVFED